MNSFKKIGIVGLGLIGGSFAKSIKKNTDCFVLGCDKDKTVLETALKEKTIDSVIGNDNLNECDLVIVCLYPKSTIDYIKKNIGNFKKGCIVIDSCGVKRFVLNELSDIMVNNDIIIIGGHPMAGSEFSGYNSSSAEIFKNASMILTPVDLKGESKTEDLSEFLNKLNFKNITVTTPENHDKMIAFTSQLAHVVSNAFVKSPRAKDYKGYSAGSFLDLTRVARLNEEMWSELFLENSDFLEEELDIIIENLTKYKKAIKDNDSAKLKELLKEGRKIKEEL